MAVTGYVPAWVGSQLPCIATIEISPQTITNLERSGVTNRAYAKFKAKEAHVIAIEAIVGGVKFMGAKSVDGDVLTVGTAATSDIGIHFFLTREPAEKYLKCIEGEQKIWSDDGKMVVKKCSYRNGKLDGLSEEWYPDGALKARRYYCNGFPDGVHEEWFPDGQLKMKCTYIDGIMGECKCWNCYGREMFPIVHEVGETPEPLRETSSDYDHFERPIPGWYVGPIQWLKRKFIEPFTGRVVREKVVSDDYDKFKSSEKSWYGWWQALYHRLEWRFITLFENKTITPTIYKVNQARAECLGVSPEDKVPLSVWTKTA